MQSKPVKRRFKNKFSKNLLYSKLIRPARFCFLFFLVDGASWGHSGPQHGGHSEDAEQDQHGCGWNMENILIRKSSGSQS